MYATAQGADTGVPKSVAKEFIASDKPGKLPSHVKRKEGGLAGEMAEGGLSPPPAPFQERTAAREISMPHGGFLNSGIAGRTDRIPAAVPPNSFVLPADVVSGAGQGNSAGGANILAKALKVGPWGVSLPAHGGSGPHFPRAPAAPKVGSAGLMPRAEGGETPEEDAKVLLAGGELVVPPWRVQAIGGGDMKKGHEAMRNMVDNIRKFSIARQQKLPPPKLKRGGLVPFAQGLDA